jgi:hypothetical protein
MNTAELNEVTELDVDYNVSQVAYIVKLLEREGLWESRSDQFPFYTIGKNSYQDNIEDYFHNPEDINVMLLAKLGDFYEEMLKILSEHEGRQVKLDPGLSIPGFHIFPASYKTKVGPWHVDIPHEKLGLGSEHAKAYTVAIEMPRGGGGIDFYKEDEEPDHIEYKTGYLYIHDGMLPHRIAGFREVHPGDYRITLQGHIISRYGELVTFW